MSDKPPAEMLAWVEVYNGAAGRSPRVVYRLATDDKLAVVAALETLIQSIKWSGGAIPLVERQDV